MPGLPGIIAKILVLVEKVLDCFVSLNATAPGGDCCSAYGGFVGDTTGCGDSLVSNLSSLLLNAMELVNATVGALMVDVQP